MELEAKIKVESHEPLRARLAQADARREGCVLELNRLFDDAARSLYRGDCGLRVRSARETDGSRETGTLTYKGPQQAGPFKRREELEIQVDSAEAAAQILAALGYVEVIRFEKRRESWQLEACRIELDELPELGRFAEVEGPDEATIRVVLAHLGLQDQPIIRTSYVAMVAEHCRATGRSPAVLVF